MSVHALGGNCLIRNSWICGRYFTTRGAQILAAVRQHVLLTVVAVGVGFAVSLPLTLLCRRWRPLRGVVLAVTSVIYTVPSLALFALLVPATGLTSTTVAIGLILYTLVIFVRNTLAGLDGVPDDVVEAARGLGYRPAQLLLRVELPLALPSIFAGLRLATVSTIALVTVGALIGNGGLGNLISDAFSSVFKAEALAASAFCVALAVLADLLLLGVQRLVMPWRRAAR